MDKFLLHLRVLDGILDKKINTLNQILNITENQKTMVSTGSQDESSLALYKEMSGEKQELIEVIKESDKVFEKTYREISSVFEIEAHKHAGLVKRIQGRIKRATTLDVDIRVQEARNNAARPVEKKVQDNKSTRKRIARIYEKNKRVSPIE